MGNLHSAKEDVATGGLNGELKPDQNNEELIELTDREKELLKDTWKAIEKDVAKVGVVMFVRYIR